MNQPARATARPGDQPRYQAWLRPAALLLLGGAVALLLFHARRFLPFIADDALISLRYSERLLAGKGLTFTDGERVEGYSNLLWVLGVAGAAPLLGGRLIVAARTLGALSMAAVVVALFHAFPPRRPRSLLGPTAAALVFAACGSIAVWAIGGLEQSLLAGLLAWSLALARPFTDPERPRTVRRAAGLGLLLGLVCLTRPDGVLLAGAIGLGLLLVARPGPAAFRSLAIVASIPILCVVGQLLFRLGYYGDWVPNTARVKLGWSGGRLAEGLRYLRDGMAAQPVAILGPLLGIVLLSVTRRRRPTLLLLIPFGLWAAYVAAIGGDIFPAYRHLVPLLVLGAFLLAEATDWLASFGRRVPASVAALVLVPATLWTGWREPEIARALDERWEWEGREVGALLQRAFGSQAPLLAADATGCLPFFSKLPALDLLGLNDRYLATHPPPGFGQGMLGHELGDGAYVLGRRPDLVFFCGPLGGEPPCFRSGVEMLADPRFRETYTLVRFETPWPQALRGAMWVRREGRVGIQRDPERIQIPGLLFAANPETVTLARADGGLQALLTPERPARIESVRVNRGRWRLDATTDGRALVEVSFPGGPPPGEPRRFPLEIDLPAPAELTLEVRAAEARVWLDEVVLERR